ncbi:MAG TPA: DUF3883 domain-containing protein [Candidatus Binataceae bacterium]|jgi:hypothetical protein|nr:DUF3883 domain-containing protein [Candidatus Binataceae bacterium]
MCVLGLFHIHRKHRALHAAEVKGRAGVGDIELTENGWSRACNYRERYWLYVVYDCATPSPWLLRVQDPFYKLVATAKGGVIVDEKEIFSQAEANYDER